MALKRFLLLGFGLWLAATVLVRLAPARLLNPDKPAAILLLYAVSFGLMFLAMRQLVVRRLEPAQARLAGIALLLPTFFLDAFTSAFFPTFFPNLPSNAAGVFGGWMLISCAGGVIPLLRR